MPEGVLSSSKGVLSNPKGVLSNPKGVLPNPKGVLLSPTNVLSSPKGVLPIPKKCCLINSAQCIYRFCKSKCKTAVLVAIAIPVFTTQLEKSRESTDIANTRYAYAEVVAEAIAATTPADLSAVVKLKQQQDGWQGADPTNTLANLDATYTGFTGSPKVTVTGTPSQGGNATIEYTAAQGSTAAAVTITFD